LIEKAKIRYAGAGTPLMDATPGAFLLVHRHSLMGAAIRFGESIRFRGKNRTFAYWNHAALVVSPGAVVEALGNGVVRTPLAKYRGVNVAHVDPVGWSAEDRLESIHYAESQLGEKYGFLTIASIGLHAITGGRFQFGVDESTICSGLVARCLERGPTIFEHHQPANITPADLARHFQVFAARCSRRAVFCKPV
jgi:uncharacterized protein YycO